MIFGLSILVSPNGTMDNSESIFISLQFIEKPFKPHPWWLSIVESQGQMPLSICQYKLDVYLAFDMSMYHCVIMHHGLALAPRPTIILSLICPFCPPIINMSSALFSKTTGWSWLQFGTIIDFMI